MSAPDLKLEAGLPANIDAEKTLLGAVLLDNGALDEIRQGLTPADFSLDSHRRIALRMNDISKRDGAIDIVTLSEELRKNHEVEAIGGVAYLASLTEGLPRRPVIDDYIRIVRDKSMLRRTMTLCSTASAEAADQSTDVLGIIGRMQNELEAIAAPAMDTDQAPVEKFIVDVAAKIQRGYDTKISPCIPTGHPWLDNKMGGGFRCGRYTIFAARPKVGKTGNALKSIAHNCQLGRHCVLFALEQDREEVIRALIPFVTDLSNLQCTRDALRTPEQQDALMRGIEIIANWRLEVYDGDLDVDQVCWAIKKTSRKNPDFLSVLDHFGLLASGEKDIRKRYVENSERLRKEIKSHPQGALVNLFQLGEVPREYADKRPQISDLSESKTKTMQDCYAAVLFHRYMDKETLKMTKKANINLALIRGGGSSGNVDGEFNSRTLSIDAEAEFEYEDYGQGQ